MYRQPLGDSFLVTFYRESDPHHVLIDCGVLRGVPQEREWNRAIVSDVAHATANHLDVIVATHPHWDHVSAFSEASARFGSMQVDEIWLPWTESPSDPLGIEHRHLRTRQLDAVRRARRLLKASGDSGSRTLRAAEARLDQVLAFHGPEGDAPDDLSAALQPLLGLGPSPRFLELGTFFAPEWCPDLRVFVVGPARDEALLGFHGHGRDRGFYGALLARADVERNDDGEIERTQPFDVRQRWTAEWRCENPLVRHLVESYEDPEHSWRRIDNEWLSCGAEIADRLLDGVNNSSLALAFELPASGEVLLFPGDAQLAGLATFQWSRDEPPPVRVSGKDLLARTVFYKVPDHGSQRSINVRSLEAMIRRDLVAAITADGDVARSLGLEMPAAPVLARLLEKTDGRVLVPRLEELAGGATSGSPSNRSLLDRTTVTPLYVDFVIP